MDRLDQLGALCLDQKPGATMMEKTAPVREFPHEFGLQAPAERDGALLPRVIEQAIEDPRDRTFLGSHLDHLSHAPRIRIVKILPGNLAGRIADQDFLKATVSLLARQGIQKPPQGLGIVTRVKASASGIFP